MPRPAAFVPRHAFPACLVALLLLGLPRASATAPTGGAAMEDSIRALETMRGKALMAADTATIGRLTADEFVEISRLGQLRSKADNLRDIASGALKLTSVKYDSTSVRIYGDVAVLRGIADNAGSFRGFPFSGRIWYTRIFVRREGRWQAVAMQHTPIP